MYLWDCILRAPSPTTLAAADLSGSECGNTEPPGAHTLDTTCQGINALGSIPFPRRLGLGHLGPFKDLYPLSGTSVFCPTCGGWAISLIKSPQTKKWANSHRQGRPPHQKDSHSVLTAARGWTWKLAFPCPVRQEEASQTSLLIFAHQGWPQTLL